MIDFTFRGQKEGLDKTGRKEISKGNYIFHNLIIGFVIVND